MSQNDDGFTLIKNELQYLAIDRGGLELKRLTGERLLVLHIWLPYTETTSLRFVGDPVSFQEVLNEDPGDGTATSSIRLPLVRVPVEAEIVYELLLKEARKKAKKKRSEGEITWWTTVYEKLIAHHRDMILVAYRDFITATNTANSRGVLASADDRTLKRNR